MGELRVVPVNEEPSELHGKWRLERIGNPFTQSFMTKDEAVAAARKIAVDTKEKVVIQKSESDF